LRKPFLDIHVKDVMPKLENSMLNGVAVIAKTYIHIEAVYFQNLHKGTIVTILIYIECEDTASNRKYYLIKNFARQ